MYGDRYSGNSRTGIHVSFRALLSGANMEVSNYLKVLWSKAMVLSVKEKAVSKLSSVC